MSTAVPPDDTLRKFLLGTLSADGTDEVRRWLDNDPANADWLERLLARDPLTDAVTDRTDDPPVAADAVERIVRGVADSRRIFVPVNADTPALATDGTTVTPFGPRDPAWPPQRLGQFRVIGELGHGGMGYVFEAEDQTLGRRVAVKVLTPELARHPGAAARFLREARAAAKVEHDNVVPVLHVGEESGAPFIVMPLLQGESLAERLKRSVAMSAAEVSRIGRDIASGLAAAHARGLIHRDLKPANVWLSTGNGRALVLDFGLARQDDGTDAITKSGVLTGTPAYMAPEQLDGQPATVRSDLFALGAVLYECATGRRAFEGPTVTAILKAVSDHHPPAPVTLNPTVPTHLSELVMRLLAKNPADRPACAAEVLAALGTSPPAPAATTATWNSTQPLAAKARVPRQFQIGCVITVSLCLLIGVGIATMNQRWQSDPPEVAQKSEPPDRSVAQPKSQPLPPAAPSRYRGKVDVQLARSRTDPLMRLNVAGALPMRKDDAFRIEAEVDPPAYLYLVWVDPGPDVTGVYPWNPLADDWRGTRPAKEEPRGRLSLPLDVSKRWTAPAAKPGVTTMVLFACEKPLDVSDEMLDKWFRDLPQLPLPQGRDDGVMWFDNYTTPDDPLRGPFGVVDADAFGQWQGQLKKALDRREVFQTAVSFARTGRK